MNSQPGNHRTLAMNGLDRGRKHLFRERKLFSRLNPNQTVRVSNLLVRAVVVGLLVGEVIALVVLTQFSLEPAHLGVSPIRVDGGQLLLILGGTFSNVEKPLKSGKPPVGLKGSAMRGGPCPTVWETFFR